MRKADLIALSMSILAVVLAFVVHMEIVYGAELGTFEGISYSVENVRHDRSSFTADVIGVPVDPARVHDLNGARLVKHVRIEQGKIRVTGGSPVDIEFDGYTRPGTWGHALLAEVK